MHSFVGFPFVVLAALLLAAGPARGGLPPMYRESGSLEMPNDSDSDTRADVLNYRLPNNTLPLHYDVELTTNVHSGDKKFTGVVKIDVTIVEATTTLVLHHRQLTIKSAKIQSSSSAVSEELDFEYELQREFLTLSRKTPENFPKDSKWTVTVEYEGQLRTDMGGFYLSTYTDADGNERYLATTQFESTDARHGFPCYDEPNKRATFTITINHSPTYSAISNMPVDKDASSSGKTVFTKTVSIPPYLIAFIVSDFVYTEGVLNGVPQRIYSRPGTEHEQEWALVSGMLILERLAEYYNVKYMLPKTDQAAIPDFSAGAMENWGLATYREAYMLYDKEKSTVNTQTNIASTIAHEYCHYWFGDYVAIEWWTYLWLKESFATLFEYKATDAAYPEWGIWQQFLTSSYQSALVNDAGNSPRPMTHYVQTPSEISRIFDTVSYSKGGSVLNMWNHALTDKVFQRGLHNYLDTNQYSSAVEEKLFLGIQNAAKELNYPIPATILDMMSSWTRQGGYPLLTVTRNYEDGSFTVSQQSFHNDEKTVTQKSWYIPFNYAHKSKPDFRDTEASHYLLNVSSVRVDAKLGKEDWLILNKQSTGYYRINYDEENWKLIIEGLNNSPFKIHPHNRAQLMHDAYRFSISNRLPHSILLDMFTYLPQEDQYAPWTTVNGIINVYNRYLNGDEKYSDFQNFVAEIATPIYEKLGVNDNPGEQHYQKNTRNVAINLACLAGAQNCLSDTNQRLRDWLEQGTPIEANLQTQVYCNGLKQSADDVFSFMFNQLMESKDQTFRRALISALGCSQNEKQLKIYLESSIDKDNKLSTQERTSILNPVYSRGSVGVMATLDFLDEHWDEYGKVNNGVGSNPLDSALRGIASYVVNTEQETRLLALVDKVKTTAHATSTLESAVKSNIQSNFEWLQSHRDPLMNWFYSYNKKDDGNGGGNDGGNGGGNGDGGGDGSAAIGGSIMTIGSLLLLVISRLY